jgi:NO-binding membrane sensor protein with MHYT domain
MRSVYNPWLVAISVSYTALRLAGCVAANEARVARIWLAVGATVMDIGIGASAVAMGAGISTMH